METASELSRWRNPPRGVAYRRWSILANGVKLALRLRIFKLLVTVSWIAGIGIAALGFLFSQCVSTGGWLESLASHATPRLHAVITVLGGFVTLYPDIVIHGIFTLIFWLHSFAALTLTLIALMVLVPRLITRDRSSQALTIYLSRPLTGGDYLVGKLGVIVATIFLVWTGPLLFGWLLSMLFATDTDFVVHSIEPLGRALLFNGICLVTLATLALGVSALGRTQRTTVSIWVGLWLILATLATPPPSPIWLKRASFSHDLHQVREQVLRLDSVLSRAAEQLPLLDRQFAENLGRAGERAQAEDLPGSLAGLGVLVVLSSFVFFRRLRPE